MGAVAVGHEAYDMLGRTPESIEVALPMRDGVIADFHITEKMLQHFIKRNRWNEKNQEKNQIKNQNKEYEIKKMLTVLIN